MGRRNDHTRKEIREMAIRAGRELIGEKGFQNFSTRKVARKIGYSPGTLYNVFDGYHGLLFHINSVTLDDLKSYIDENLDHHLEGIEAIKGMADCYIEFANEKNFLWSALFEYQLPQDAEAPEWYLLKVNSIFAIAEKLLLPFVHADVESAKRTAKVLWGAVHGICSLGLTRKMGQEGTQSLKAMADSLIKNYIKGLSQD